jgi:hypothetical protein
VTKAHGLRTTLRQEGEQILLALGICQQLQPLPIHQDSLNFAGVICQSHCGQDGYFNLRLAILACRVDGIPQDACDPNASQLHFDDILLCLKPDDETKRKHNKQSTKKDAQSHGLI